jgi:hypothetical protein
MASGKSVIEMHVSAVHPAVDGADPDAPERVPTR